MKQRIILSITCFLWITAHSQNVGINNNDPKSALDINGGLRIRPVTTLVSGTSVILNPTTGYHFLNGTPSGNFTINFSPAPIEGQHTIVTNTTTFAGNVFSLAIAPAVTVELFYSNGGWKQIGNSLSIASTAWTLTGNSGAAGAKFGHIEPRAIQFISNNQHVGRLGGNNNILLGLLSGESLSQTTSPESYFNIAIGNDALKTTSSAVFNIALGHSAMAEATGGTTGIAIGGGALNKQTSGASENIAIGYSSQLATTSGSNNISIGRQSLFNNTTGRDNVAIGWNTLFHNISTDRSTAIGHYALERAGNVLSPNITNNTAVGFEAMRGSASSLLNIGRDNTAMGIRAMASYSNAWWNVAIGSYAMELNTTGSGNVAIGDNALRGSDNATGFSNVAVGFASLGTITTGSDNTALGSLAAKLNTSGYSNVALGTSALFANTTKSNLVAVGDSALFNNGAGSFLSSHAIENTAVGSKSLFRNTTGSYNTSFGYNALYNNGAGIQNTAVGNDALFANTIGENNVAVGNNALRTSNGYSNTAIGAGAMFNHSSGLSNTALGVGALSGNISGSNNIAIGANAGLGETTSNKLYIESSNANKDNALIYGDFAADSLLLNTKTINKFSLNVRGSNALEMGYGTTNKQTDAGKICYGCFGDPVHWLGIVGGGTSISGNDRVIKLWSEGGLRIKGHALPDLDNSYSLGNNTNRWNQVWAVSGIVNSSDANLKTNIMASPYGLDEVMQMNPVQYNWKTNPNEDLQIGFLAQDIQKIIPEAVVVPDNGSPLGMKYTELIPVLVKGMQEQQRIIENQQKQIDELYRLLREKK